MANIEYSNSPNVETAFVLRDDGKKNRAVLMAPQDTSTLEYPVNPNSTKGYVTVDGKKHRVVLVADVVGGGGGGSVDYTKVVSKTATMPTASASNANIIYLYDGETNGTYHHGYIYENKRSATYTSTVSFEPATSSGTTVTCSGSNFATFLTEAGANPLPIVSGTMTYDASGGGWRLVGKDADDQTITTFFEYNEDYADAGFTFTGTPVDGDIIAFTCTVEEDTVTYAWTRLDVQPGGAGAGVNSLNGQTGDLNIKSVNGHALLGSGDLELSTYLTFPNSWTTNSTTKAFCDAVAADNTAVAGKAYLGEVTFSDLPASMENAEIVVEIMAGTTAANKVILLSCTSGNTAPYKWQYTYWNNGTNVSGWQGFQEQLVSGTNIKTVNNTSLLGAGDITIDSLPSQTGQSGKFLTTDGTDASWATLPSGSDFVPQLSTLPTAGATNFGDIVQYSGATVPDVDASATGTQTAGSGLTDISVNVATFEGVEQPAGAETVEFTASVTQSSMTFTSVPQDVSITVTDADAFVGWIRNNGANPADWTNAMLHDNGSGFWSLFKTDMSTSIGGENQADWANYGIVITGTPSDTYDAVYELTVGSTTWTKDAETVDIAAYGVSFTGTPSNNDEITVVYTPAVKGVTSGYFYESVASYSDPSATISQTTGSGLTDLSVNVDTFIAAEQPAGDESVVFTAEVTPASTSYTTTTGSITLSGGNLAGLFSNYGWPFGDSEYNGVIVFENGQDCYVGPEVGSNWFYTNVGVLESYGIQITGTPAAGDVVEYSYSDGSTSWTKDGNTVDLAIYGVSLSGVPNDGDELTVVYTASAISGYAWEQKDVQPSSGSGGAGIDWKTDVDLPANWQQGSWNIAPLFTITGGLPDGTYEFYYKMACGGSFSNSANVWAYLTFKFIIKINNSDNSFYGMYTEVLDGNTIGNNNRKIGNREMYSLLKKDLSGNLYIYANEQDFMTDVHGHVYDCPDIPHCFRLSSIKNIDTGETYIATGSLYNEENFDIILSGSVYMTKVQETPTLPESYSSRNFNLSDFSSNTALYITPVFFSGTNNGLRGTHELTVCLTYGEDMFYAKLTSMYDSYELTVEEATGIFADVEFGRYNNNPVIVPNFTSGLSGIFYGYIAAYGISSNAMIDMYATQLDDMSKFVALNPLKIGVTPTAPNYLGKIRQYDGTTTGTYTNGYFYKVTGSVVNVPSSVTCTETSAYGKTITMDVDGFISYMSTLGYDASTIVSWLNGGYTFEYNVDNQSLTWGAYGMLDPSALQYFTFSPAAQSGEYITWTTSNCVLGHKELQNGAWEEVKTQPGATTPTTMPTLVVANWSANTQTVTVNGVTASNNVIVAPAPASSADWASAGVLCTAQGANSLTFTCTQTPSNDITVNVAII